jgi:hypothetical protein
MHFGKKKDYLIELNSRFRENHIMIFTGITDLSNITCTQLGQTPLHKYIVFRFRIWSVREIGFIATILTSYVYDTLQASTIYTIYI